MKNNPKLINFILKEKKYFKFQGFKWMKTKIRSSYFHLHSIWVVGGDSMSHVWILLLLLSEIINFALVWF